MPGESANVSSDSMSSTTSPARVYDAWLSSWSPPLQTLSGLSAAVAREAQVFAAGSAEQLRKAAELQLATAARALAVRDAAGLAALSSHWTSRSMALASAEAERGRQAAGRIMQALWPGEPRP